MQSNLTLHFSSLSSATNMSVSALELPFLSTARALAILELAVYIGCAVLAVVLIDVVFLARRPRPGEPPVVRSFVPFLHSAVSFGLDGLGLFSSCRAQYGDVFTIQLANQAMHAVCDPRYYPAVLRNKDLNFHEIGKTIQNAIFDQSMISVQSVLAHRESHAQYVQYLSGPKLEEVTAASCMALRGWMKEDRERLGVGQWKSVDLDAFVSQVMVRATLESLFGRAVAAQGPALHRSTRVIDRSFFKLFYALPRFLCKDAHEARQHLIRTCMTDGEPDEGRHHQCTP